MALDWKHSAEAVDWEELSALYRAAPLGDKKAAHLQTVFSNSRYVCFAYDAGRLVSHHQRRDATPAAAVVSVNVAATDPAGPHFDQQIARAEIGTRHVDDFKGFVLLQHQRFHVSSRS